MGKIRRAKKCNKKIKTLYKSREKIIKLFDDYSRTVPETDFGEGLKILTPKQMLQRLPIAHAQVKTGNTFENLLNEIRQITYSLYRANEITKKVYNNIMKLYNQIINQNGYYIYKF